MPDEMPTAEIPAPEIRDPDIPSPELMERIRAAFGNVRKLPDESLIAMTAQRSIKTGQLGLAAFEMEMQRRLKDSVAALTTELVTFRESADQAASRADAAAGKLTRLTWALIGFTGVLVVLTVVLVILTVRLLALG